MTKKITAIILSLMIGLMGFAFTGCGDKNSGDETAAVDTSMFMGQWTAHSEDFGDFSLAFDEDGCAAVSAMGIESVGTWAANEDGTITVTTDDFDDIVVSEKNGQLSYEFSDETLVFDKYDPEAAAEEDADGHVHADGEEHSDEE